MHSAGIEEALTPCHHSAVIGIVNNDGVLVESVFFQSCDALGNIAVHPLHRIGILRVVFANYREIRMIGKKSHLRGIVLHLIHSSMRLALMAGRRVVDAEERLAFLAGLPPIR